MRMHFRQGTDTPLDWNLLMQPNCANEVANQSFMNVSDWWFICEKQIRFVCKELSIQAETKSAVGAI